MMTLVIVVSAVLVLSCGETNTQDTDECLTPATVLSVSNNLIAPIAM